MRGLVLLLLSSGAWAQTEGPANAPVPAAEARSVGVHAAVNVGLLMVDLHLGRSYSFLAGNAGIPLLSNGAWGAFAVGTGYSLAISQPDESMWVFDLFGVLNPGWTADVSRFTSYSVFVGVGIGVGFRYLHWSGFTFGLKAPVFGAAINGGPTSSQAVATFYLANLTALPIISFGYRW